MNAAIKKLPSLRYLRACFIYERRTGFLFWKRRPRSHFPSAQTYKAWNARWAGKRAFTAVKEGVYFYGTIGGVSYVAHRVVWKLVSGKEPPPIIDHRDRDGFNNRWKNLRVATHGSNFINRVTTVGVSGFIGVKPHKEKWVVRIQKDKKPIYIGIYATKEEAVAARNIKTVELFGEFAP